MITQCKKIYGLVVAFLISVIFSNAQQVVTSATFTGPGSLSEAISNAYNAGGNQTITFNITPDAPIIAIDVTSIGLYNSGALTSLIIDATTQPGWVAGQPKIILRGNGNAVGFNVGASNVTIRGFILQNFTNAYYQYSGNNNKVEGCWFGVDATGTVSSNDIKEYGVLIQSGSSRNFTLGNTSLSLASRNIVSGCGIGGIKFDGAGNGNTVVNTYIGTDLTGTMAVGNGTIMPANSETQHGISINSTQRVTITNNVISANTSGGIDIAGGSDFAVISKNKIGTDVTGLKPLGNNTFGIRIKGSSSHTIGGATKADGNIISANGSDFFEFFPYSVNSAKYDWYNSSGIYLSDTRNTAISNNLIGVDATGNSSMSTAAYDMGNFYCGIKIENGSSNVTISQNVVSGNGFRSNVAYFLIPSPPVTDPLKGHGILVKDAGTTNTVITGNIVGLGLDGKTKIGNRQDGISIQGAASSVIGGTTAALRNVVAGNIWGIYVASNYYNSQSTNCKIIGNYVGTDATGAIAIGNTEGGIGVINYSQNTQIGGANAGEGNVVSANAVGISIGGVSPTTGNPIGSDAGKAPTLSKVYGNLIGLAANGTTLMPNTENGIYLYDLATQNEIGGLLAGQGNKIVGNAANGIYLDASTSNNIQGNIISNNAKSGIGLNASSTNTIRANSIVTNGASGIVLQANSANNKLFANTIGDLTDVTKANTGDGIRITASNGNIIGSTTSGTGNIIGNNTGNGVIVTDASRNNAIHNNQMACNKLRGIELSGLGNLGYPKPTFSGSATALVITGSVGSYIELYSLDACNNCAVTTNNKLQGRTLIASGASPLNYPGVAGTFYTATASESNSATVGHNTSEFSDCYTLCPTPNLSLSVTTNSPVCVGNTATVTIVNSQVGRDYQVFNGAVAVSAKVTGTGANLTINTTLALAGSYTLSISVSQGTCTPSTLTQKPTIVINSSPDVTLAVTSNSPVCVGNAAIVTIVKSELNKVYEVYNGATSVSSQVTGTGNDLPITLNALVAGTYTLTIKVSAGGCVTKDLTQQPVVVINNSPDVSLAVTSNSPVCVGNSAIVTIVKSELNKVYEVYNGATSVSSKVTGTGNDLPITLNALVAGTYTLTIKVSAGGCVTKDLTQKPVVVINSSPDVNLVVTSNSPVCVGNAATVTIVKSELNKVYEVFNGSTSVSSKITGTGNDLPITLNTLVAGTYTLTIKVSAGGCVTKDLTQQPVVVINSSPDVSLAVTSNSPVCLGNAAIVTIVKSELNKVYEVYNGATSVSSKVTGTGNDLPITLNALVAGTYTLTIKVSAGGCTIKDLTQKPVVVINSDPDVSLAVTSNSPVCVGNPAIVTIVKSELNKVYEVYNGTTSVSSKITGTGNNLPITLNTLVAGSYTLTIKVSAGGCVTKDLNQKPVVVINSTPDIGLAVTTNSPVCVGNVAIVTIVKSELNKTYEVYDVNTSVSSVITGTGNDLPITLKTLTPGSHTLTIRVGAGGCVTQELTQKPVVIINSVPKIDSDVTTNTPICFGVQGILTVVSSEAGKSYQVFDENGTSVSAVTLSSANGVLNINLNAIPVGSHVLTVKATVPGCTGNYTLTKTSPFVVNNGLDGALALVHNGPICLGSQATITIKKSQSGVSYQAFNKVDNLAVSGVVLGDGNDILINLNPLPSGSNEIYFKGTIGGCGTVVLGNTATIVVNTDVIKTLNVTATSPVCFGSDAVVSISASEAAKSYQVFEKSDAVSAIVQGNGGKLDINVPGLAIGDHTFTIHVTVPGCKSDTLLQNPTTKVNSAPRTDLKVGTNGPVCAGNQAFFYVLNSEVGKKYQIFNGATSVSQIEIGTGDSLKIQLSNLAPGTYTLTAKVTSDGCNTSVDLTDKGTITINSIPKTDLTATVNGPVCVDIQAIVTVLKAEKGKSYQVFYNGISLSASLLGNDADLDIPVITTSLGAGTFDLSIGISVPGCVADTLTTRPRLTINKSPNSGVTVSALQSPICVNTDGAVVIGGIEPNVTYEAFIGSGSVSVQLSGAGPNLTLPILASKLSVGLNNISVKASIPGCTAVPVADTAGIIVNPNPKLDLAISVAPDVICKGGESILTIYSSEVGVSYQAVVGTRVVSDAVLGNGGLAELVLFGLSQGSNTVAVLAKVGGCSVKNLDSTATVTVNGGPKTDYGITGDVVCKGESGIVTINGSEIGATYEAFNKTTNASISNPVPGTGGAISFTLLPSNNPVDTVIIKATVQGCTIVRLDSQTVVKTNDLTKSKDLAVLGSSICVDDLSGTVTIKNAQNGVTYEAKIGGKIVQTLTASATADLVFTIPVVELTSLNNEVTFTATVQECTPVDLTNSAFIIINNINDSKNLAVVGSTICVYDLTGTATIKSAKNGVEYTAILNGKSVQKLVASADADLVFTLLKSDLKLGSNSVSFKAFIIGCDTIALTNQAMIIVNDTSAVRGLQTAGSTVCANNQFATATIFAAKRGFTYDAYVGSRLVGSATASVDGDLVISVLVANLSSGANEITFYATIPGCDRVELANRAYIIVNGNHYPIDGDNIVCFNSTGTYSIPPIPGITNFTWTLPDEARITSGLGTNVIELALGTKSGYLKVVPQGFAGTCDVLTDSIYINVLAPLVDTVKINGLDTVCVNGQDWIQIDSLGVANVDTIRWHWSKGIKMLDTLHKDSLFQAFNIQYLKTGMDTIIAAPYERCSSTYQYSKSDTLFVKVLGYPVANANEYAPAENDYDAIQLNGTGSSLNGVPPADSLTYRWSTTQKDLQILNANTLNNASIVVSESVTYVYLTVKNHNRCPATDTAKITLNPQFDIPNVFSPNNDGVHDKWEIKNLHNLHPNVKVEIFNKWGNVIYRSSGYAEPWDGTRNGEEMPVSTYYYLIDLKDGKKAKVGSVTILR